MNEMRVKDNKISTRRSNEAWSIFIGLLSQLLLTLLLLHSNLSYFLSETVQLERHEQNWIAPAVTSNLGLVPQSRLCLVVCLGYSDMVVYWSSGNQQPSSPVQSV